MVKYSAGEVKIRCVVCDVTMSNEVAVRLHNKKCTAKHNWKAHVKECNDNMSCKSMGQVLKSNANATSKWTIATVGKYGAQA